MISTEGVLILAVVGSFAAGSFIASPELRAYASTIANDVICTGCVGTSDIAGNAVTAAKIKDNEVKAAEIASGAVGASEIATDAVGAAELQGVTKLLFGQCSPTDSQKLTLVAPGNFLSVVCNISGVDVDDIATTTLNDTSSCFEVRKADAFAGSVHVRVANDCDVSASLTGDALIAVIVFDK